MTQIQLHWSDRLIQPHSKWKNGLEEIFYLDGISPKLGGRTFNVIQSSSQQIQLKEVHPKRALIVALALNILKVIIIATIIAPFILGLMRCKQRQEIQTALTP